MVDLKAYRSIHKSDQYERPGTTAPLRDELGPEAMAREEPPDDRFELLLPPTIKGFNMRRKKWFDLIAERITDVEWNEDAFKKVVMNSKAKDLIQALVSDQLASEASTDLIANKGNGLILLLHGGPGTGKTLTAEGVAEITKKPLYRVTCADIGTKPEEAEKYLESILHLGKLWKCVVLLDEAVRVLCCIYRPFKPPPPPHPGHVCETCQGCLTALGFPTNSLTFSFKTYAQRCSFTFTIYDFEVKLTQDFVGRLPRTA